MNSFREEGSIQEDRKSNPAVRDTPWGRSLLRPGVTMNSDRTPGSELLPRNTEPPELLAAISVDLSLKVTSLNGPFPRTAARRLF